MYNRDYLIRASRFLNEDTEERIVANDDNIKEIVEDEIKRLGNKADLNHIDVSGVTNMNKLFSDSIFNGDISKWNVGNVKDMIWMFSNSKFNQDISSWDVSNVEDMYGMFSNSKFNQDISNWDVSNVVDMDKMFENSPFDKNIDMWNYNFKLAEEYPWLFELRTTGSYTLIEKYANAIQSKKFDLAEKIKFKMKGIRFNKDKNNMFKNTKIKSESKKVLMDETHYRKYKQFLRERTEGRRHNNV